MHLKFPLFILCFKRLQVSQHDMEERSFCLIGAAYLGSGAPMDKSLTPRDLFGFFWISLSIVISGQVLKR